MSFLPGVLAVGARAGAQSGVARQHDPAPVVHGTGERVAHRAEMAAMLRAAGPRRSDGMKKFVNDPKD
jgi:hypothetical protein